MGTLAEPGILQELHKTGTLGTFIQNLWHSWIGELGNDRAHVQDVHELHFMGNDDAAQQEVRADWELLPADGEKKSHHGSVGENYPLWSERGRKAVSSGSGRASSLFCGKDNKQLNICLGARKGCFVMTTTVKKPIKE